MAISKAGYWTSERFDDVVWALEILLSRVPPEALSGKPAELRSKAQAWFDAAKLAADQPEGSLVAPPRFPLSGAELRSLQTEIERVAAHQAASTQAEPGAQDNVLLHQHASAPIVTTRRRIHSSLADMQRSSTWVAVALVVSLAVSVLDIVLFVRAPDHLGIGLAANVALLFVALGFWLIHHEHLVDHSHMVNLRLHLP